MWIFAAAGTSLQSLAFSTGVPAFEFFMPFTHHSENADAFHFLRGSDAGTAKEKEQVAI